MKNHTNNMATQNSLLMDRKRSRPDIMTTDFDSAQICSWPRFLLIKGIMRTLYTTPLSKVIQNYPGICFHFYADDTQLYVHLTHNHATQAFDRLKNCLDDVRRWLSAN